MVQVSLEEPGSFHSKYLWTYLLVRTFRASTTSARVEQRLFTFTRGGIEQITRRSSNHLNRWYPI